MNVAEITEYVRDTLDVDQEDMPDRLVSAWCSEGYIRAHRLARTWPTYEVETVLMTVPAQQDYAMDGSPFAETGLREVTYIEGPDGRLQWWDEGAARNAYFWQGVPLTRRPEGFSVRAGVLRLWPTPDAEYEMVLHGYRYPVKWPSASAGDNPDLPDDFGVVIRAWVMHKAYLHQDDPDLAELSKREFDEGLALLADSELSVPIAQPTIIGGSRRHNGLPYRLRLPWE